MIKKRRSIRGQITIFVIIAILIVAGLVLFFIFGGGIQREMPVAPEIAPIQNFVENCIYDSGEDALYFIGLNGGYYLPSRISTSDGIPYYIKNNQNIIPAKEKIELEISKYVDEAISLCTGNFTEFSGFQITQGKIQTQTIILENEVILSIKYPLLIVRGEEKSRIEKFDGIKIPIRLGKIYNASSFIVGEHLKNEGEVCVSCILDLQEKENISIIMQSGNQTIIYGVYDSLSLFEGEDEIFEPLSYNFRFAVEY